jgi:hypothetical protein
MKIKLSSLGLPKTTGTLQKSTNSAYSSSPYATAIVVSEIYWQQKTGTIGGVRIGTEDNVWIPFAAVTGSVDISYNDRLTISVDGVNKIYQVQDLQKKLFSDFEDHYELNLVEYLP